MMGEQFTPDEVGKEAGVRIDLLRGFPKPRKINSQEHQIKDSEHGENKAVKSSVNHEH